AQRQVFERLRNGSRPEEIAQARANVEAAKADDANARLQYERIKALVLRMAASQQDLENAQAAYDVAASKLAVSRKALDLAVAGPRGGGAAGAGAGGGGAGARLALRGQPRADPHPRPPADAVVRPRLLEPGEMSTPMRPVFTLAITDPKWVRAYVAEP